MPERERSRPVLWTVVVAVVALSVAGCGGADDSLAERQAEVAERGAQVMPFDLDATTHTFSKRSTRSSAISWAIRSVGRL